MPCTFERLDRRALACALLVVLTPAASADTIGYVWSSPIYSGDGRLTEVVLETGAGTLLDEIAGRDLDGGTALPDGRIVAIDGYNAEFWELRPTPGVLGHPSMAGVDAGMSYDVTTGTLYAISGGTWSDPTSVYLYRVDPDTGATTYVGRDTRYYASALAINQDGEAFAVDATFSNRVFSVNLTTGTLTPIASIPSGTWICGMDFAPDGNLWAIADDSLNKIYRIDPNTWQVTLVSRLAVGRRYNFLAIPWTQPEPYPGDLDGDGDVDLADLAQLLAHYGMTSGATHADGDLDGDGDVDLADLAGLLADYTG